MADRVGTAFGRLAVEHFAATPEDFLRLVASPPHPLLPMVSCLAHAPSRLRTRGRGSLLDRLQQDPLSRDTRRLLEMAWTLYKVFRLRASPQAPQPTVDDADVPVRLTRAAARYLRPRGVTVAVDLSSAVSRRDAAARCLRALWQAMTDRSCVVWFDNFYRRRFMRTPRRMDASLNCTVVAVLVLPPPADGIPRPRLPPFPGWPTHWQLFVHGPAAAAAVAADLAGRIRSELTRVCALAVGPDDFRVPLDLPRRGAESLPWRPYALADHVVSGQVGLLEVLADLRAEVLPHAAPAAGARPMPLLLDVNLWYRVLKLVYGREAQRWDAAGALARMPPLYAVWHPYKQVLHAVHQRFQPFLQYVAHGRLPPGKRWRSYPDLQTLERWLAALLLVPEDRRARLRRALARYESELATLDRAITQLEADATRVRALHAAAAARVQRRFQHAADLAADWWPDAETRRLIRESQEAHGAVVRLEDALARHREARRLRALELPVLRGFADLILEWAPACLLLGFYVRQCHWGHWEPGTGAGARDVLLLALALLSRLEGWAERRRTSEYVRTLALALLTWTPWHDGLPAACFSEEPCEAGLGRLGGMCERHPQAVDTADVMDLYLLVQPPQPGERRDLRPGNWGELWNRQAQGRVDALLDHVLIRPAAGPVTALVTYVATQSLGGAGAERRELRADARWPEDWAPPPSPLSGAADDADAVGDLMRRALRGMIIDQAPTPEAAAALDQLCPRRPDGDVDRNRDACDAVVGRRPSGPRQPPSLSRDSTGRCYFCREGNTGDSCDQTFRWEPRG